MSSIATIITAGPTNAAERLAEACEDLGVSYFAINATAAISYVEDVEAHYGQELVTEDWITVINSYSRTGLVLI